MKQTFTTLLTLLLVLTSFGQDDKSKKILQDISAKNKAYKTIIISFTATITMDEDVVSQSGKAYMKGDKYFVQLEDQEMYNDGVTITTYLKDENECYTSLVADSEEEDMVSPSQLLSIWEDGYNSKYYKETEFAGKKCHQIHLYPKNPKESKIHTIILKIDQTTNEVLYVLIKGKDGTKTKYILKKMEHDVTVADAKFVFNKAKHPGVECYDE